VSLREAAHGNVEFVLLAVPEFDAEVLPEAEERATAATWRNLHWPSTPPLAELTGRVGRKRATKQRHLLISVAVMVLSDSDDVRYCCATKRWGMGWRGTMFLAASYRMVETVHALLVLSQIAGH